jgi:transposase
MHSERLSPNAASRLAFHREPNRLPATYCETLYRQRHKVEKMFAKLKDWRRVSMRYDRFVHTFFSAICIAATVIFWLGQ